MPKTTNQKEHIVKAALKLFATHGYGSTSVRDIAKAAKVSPSLLYNFFASKEDVLKEIIERGFRDIRKSLEVYNNKAMPPRKAIGIHVNTTFAIIKKHIEFWRLLHSIRLQDKVLAAGKKSFDEMIRFITATFTSIFKKLGYRNPQLEAILFLTQIDGLVILYLQDPKLDTKKLEAHLIQRYKK